MNNKKSYREVGKSSIKYKYVKLWIKQIKLSCKR